MAIDRVQPPSGMSPHWDKKAISAAKPATRSLQGPQAADAVQAARTGGRAGRSNHKSAAPANLQALSEKLKASQSQGQDQIRLSALDKSLVVTQQELAKATQEQISDTRGVNGSYWENLDVVEKARAINRLKDKLAQLQTERGQLVASLTEQVRQGTYHVSGEEIATGIAEESN
jgi:hypothetical protein